jgi:hypothetical protein
VTRHLHPSERVGLIAGGLLAPLVACGSLLRQSRLFHPRGVVLAGRASPLGSAEHRLLGTRLTGPVLVRFSGAWWKRKEWLDVLGCAVRFGSANAELDEPEPGDQDLLLATIRLPVTTLLAPLSTRFHAFLANAYFAVSPFELRGLGRYRLRLLPLSPDAPGDTREERLRHALLRGPVRLELQARPAKLKGTYAPIALLELDELRPDNPDLSFDPFRCGRGFEPAGFVHFMRVATYAASRRARALVTERARAARPTRPTNGAGSLASSVG